MSKGNKNQRRKKKLDKKKKKQREHVEKIRSRYPSQIRNILLTEQQKRILGIKKTPEVEFVKKEEEVTDLNNEVPQPTDFITGQDNGS